MIPAVTLVKSGITLSRLGFGTSRLHYLRKSERQHLLYSAAELGVTHFDTAPAYGDGIAETELRTFFRGQRDRFTISTKYGLPHNPLIERWPSLMFPLRAANMIARKAGIASRRAPPLTASGLRISVEGSLRRLGTDRIDILLLHEPRIDRLPFPSDVLDELRELQHRALICAFGLAGAWPAMVELLSLAPELGMIVQTADAQCPAELCPDIIYGTIAPGRQSYLSPDLPKSEARSRLRSALERRPYSVVLVSTTKFDHLVTLAQVMHRIDG